MRYLGLALFAEGGRDHSFLRPLLRRLVEDMCARRAAARVEIGDVIELHTLERHRGQDRATRILEAARDAEGSFDLLFVHTDGGSNASLARKERVDPAIPGVAYLLAAPHPRRGVGVVPVRETEAWALADGDALRKAFGSSLDDSALGVPTRAREVESILDAKAALEDAYAAVVGARRRRRRTASSFLEVIAEGAGLQRLRAVPSFRELETELGVAIDQLAYLSR